MKQSQPNAAADVPDLRVFVVSLRHSHTRRQRITEQAGRIGLNFEFFDAIDGRALSLDELAACVDETARRACAKGPLSSGAIGCALSHRALWTRLSDDSAAAYCILEDDAVISPELPRALSEIAGHMDDFDLLHLYIGKAYRPCREVLPIGGSFWLSKVKYQNMTTVAYVITRCGARHMLERFPRIVREIDTELNRWWANGLRVYELTPQVVGVDPALTSTIGISAQAPRWADDSLRDRLRRRLDRVADSLVKRVKYHLTPLR